MAEFKLGRIRFVWKNTWSTSTTYYKDDVVSFGGRTYICVIGHNSSADFFTDFNISPPKWNLVSDGTSWKGEWSTGVSYIENDIVQYGARLYICQTNHTSVNDSTLGLENDISAWQLYAEGLDYKGAWTTATRYIVNDVVKYGGTTYVCNTYHTSASTASSGLESDQAKWDYFNQGLEYNGDWTANTRYKVNDIVRYGAALWIVTTQHTSSTSFGSDESNWTQFVRGIQFETEWDVQKNYQPGDIVRYGGNQFIAKTNHSGQNPVTSTTNWSVYSEGIRFLGEWGEDSSSQDYKVGEVVRHGAYTYICTATHNGQEPPNASYWNRLNTGLKWRGIWADDRQYMLGDVVRYLDNSYVCILGHLSEGDDGSSGVGAGAGNSRPDQDTTGTYWNIIAVGSEQSVLTTKGDLVYYSGTAPTRLPVGAEGQVLRVGTSDIPEWAYMGVADDVYHVATHGTDAPAPTHGRTIDKPWASIRYACKQVEEGLKNPNAKSLLELNRPFIQKEIRNWVDYQITNTITPFAGSYVYDTLKCERDMGLIVDALIWDITHGGNVKSRESAIKYVTEPGSFYTLGQSEETVAAINYGLTVISSVLAQTAPSANYQTLNGDNSTAVVTQYFDSTLIAETGVYTEITGLAGIITGAITANSTANIPVRLIRSVLIKVATGKYYETLPILVPAETCVIGDELRSTNVQPRKASNSSLTSRSDAEFSFKALERVESIIGDIVLGSTVSKTTGNTKTQSQLFPFGEAQQSNAAKQLTRIIRRNADHKVGDKVERTLVATASTHDVNYGYARDLLLANKEFIKAEVTGYLTTNYSTLKYSKTKCKQDVGYIIDSLVYDLSYQGTWQSITAGLAYYAGTSGSLQINSTEKAATLQAYVFMRSLLQTIAQNVTVNPTQQSAITQINGTAGNTAAAAQINTLMTIVIDIINLGTASAPSITYPDISGVASALTTASTTLSSNYTTLKSEMVAFISYNFPNLTHDSAKCERDLGYILDAARYDWMLGTNFAGIVTAYSYLRTSANKVTGPQKTATLAGFEFARQRARTKVGGNSIAQAYIDSTFEIVNDIILGGSNEANTRQIDEFNNYSAIRQLQLNEDFIVDEVHAYITNYYKSNVTNITGSSNTLTVSSTAWMKQNMMIKFVSPDDSTNTVVDAGLVENQIYYVKDIKSSTSLTISSTIGGAEVSLVDYEFDFVITLGYTYTRSVCSRDIKEYLKAIRWDLKYPADFSREYRDTVNSTNFNFIVPGIYKTALAARYYGNAIIGSQEEDFYYLRNGTGIRLQTLDGLQGDLGPANAYGTSRPSAGAYASLDPGWGPDDERVWITARSPYVQNCTTFGTAATGQRIDGALHNGGNDSIVSNDFTQVISDGIGAHILNNGRAELVSVFTYYSHVGYLAESGGRVRATNGNNSYGDFGSVAEGFDTSETQITGVVDNSSQYRPTISLVQTDGAAEILQVEYSHAGSEATRSEINFFGPGTNELAKADEFRDDGVFQVRLLDLDDSSGDIGGSGYTITANTAQSGTTSQIILSATDSASSSDYPGMKVIITGGTGAGQYAIINTYNSGTKVATVNKQSTGTSGWETVVPGREIVAPSSTSTYQIEPAISFNAPTNTSQAATLQASDTWRRVHYVRSSANYTGVTGTTSGHTGTVASFDIDRVDSKYFVTIENGGTDYTRLETVVVPGTSLGGATPANDLTLTITTVNAVTGAIVDFDFAGNGLGGKYLLLGDDTIANESIDGVTWTAKTVPTTGSGGTWRNVANGFLDDGSSSFETTAAVAVTNGSLNYMYSTNGNTWTGGTLPSGIVGTDTKDVAYGEVITGVSRFVIINPQTTNVITSDDGGASWILRSGALPSTGHAHITYGQGRFVAVKDNASAATDTCWSTDGVTWTQGASLPTGNSYKDLAYGNNLFIAISSTNNKAAISSDGKTWREVGVPSIDGSSTSNYTSIAYGHGVFVAAADNNATVQDYNSVVYTEDGVHWYTQGVTVGGNIQGFGTIAFGNPNRVGGFVAIDNAGSTNIATLAKIGARARGRANIASEKIFEIKMEEPGSGYTTPPTMTVTDPSNIYDINFTVRTGKGVSSQPSFEHRGAGFLTATATVDAVEYNGGADFFQTGNFIAARRLTKRPVAGSNVVFDSLPNKTFKLVDVITFLGTNDGSYTGFLQISPNMTVTDAVVDGDPITMRIRYSQVRLTGHDFLDIGTGNFTKSNYPGVPTVAPDQTKETQESNGGRVFFTATDQDGNFRVGNLFSVEQATGVATLNADAFNIAGLQELTLGEVTLGGNSASITEFSTDPFFTANSDTVVPTQRAVKAYIEAQIGGGGASLNVNSVTAGDIFVGSNIITNVTSGVININARMNFIGGVTGIPIAFNYFLR